MLLGLALAPILLRTRETPEEERRHIAENMQNPEAMEHSSSDERTRLGPLEPSTPGCRARTDQA